MAMPAFSPAALDTIPMIQGIRIPPKLAAGSMTPILATLVIFPAQATAVGSCQPWKMQRQTAEDSSNLIISHHQADVK